MKALLLIYCLFLCSTISKGAVITIGFRKNWALLRNTTQSTTSDRFTSDKAVDGKITNVLAGESCSQTQSGKESWWVVHLSVFVVVDEVFIVNRGDCCGERLNNFDIEVLEGPMELVGVCYSNRKHLKTGDAVLFPCTKPLTGEHVRIKLQKTGALTLCEVKIFGRPFNAGSDSGSWALGTPAEQSTATSKGAYPGQAVDGEFSGDFKKHKCAQTKPTDPNPWWMADMMDNIEVTLVRIWNRTDCCSKKLQNIYIDLLDDKKDKYPRACGHRIKPVHVFVVIKCATPVIGRWIKVTKKVKAGLDGDLTLCEVEVSGRRLAQDPEFRKRQDNHAIGRPATQSLSGLGILGVAKLAVDGNIFNSALSYSCSITAIDDIDKQWWKVNVGYMFVEAVAIVLPNYCCEKALSYLNIWVESNLCGKISNRQTPGAIVSAQCPKNTVGSYVIIYKRPPRTYISLCEVEVYGIPKERNWALGRHAYIEQKASDVTKEFAVVSTVDGDVSNGYGSEACPGFSSQGGNLKLVVDLQDAHVYVRSIKYVIPASNGAPVSIRNPVIELRDELHHNVHTGCHPDRNEFTPGYVVTVTCDASQSERLANRVILINDVNEESLHICEVEIYGLLAFFK